MKPKIAWCHRANDNYYTDEQFRVEIERDFRIELSHIKCIEHSAYTALLAEAMWLKEALTDIRSECTYYNQSNVDTEWCRTQADQAIVRFDRFTEGQGET